MVRILLAKASVARFAPLLPLHGGTGTLNNFLSCGTLFGLLQPVHFVTLDFPSWLCPTFVYLHFRCYLIIPAHEHKWAEGDWFISIHASAKICTTVRLPSPGMVSNNSSSSLKGRIHTLTSSSSLAMVPSKMSIWFTWLSSMSVWWEPIRPCIAFWRSAFLRYTLRLF